jgi:hypothetical protein
MIGVSGYFFSASSIIWLLFKETALRDTSICSPVSMSEKMISEPGCDIAYLAGQSLH